MGCYYHEGAEDVAICPQCGKKLCRGCASVTNEGICYNCAMKNNLKIKSDFKFDLIFAIVCSIVFIVSLILAANNVRYAEYGIVIVGFVPAWRFLTWLANTILPPRVYAIGLYIVLTIVKLILALLLSVIIPFVYIIKVLVNISKYRAVAKNIEIIENNFRSI